MIREDRGLLKPFTHDYLGALEPVRQFVDLRGDLALFLLQVPDLHGQFRVFVAVELLGVLQIDSQFL